MEKIYYITNEFGRIVSISPKPNSKTSLIKANKADIKFGVSKVIENKIVNDIPFLEEELEKDLKPLYSYQELVEAFIKQKYSITEEISIIRQKDIKPEEFEIYNEYCEKCKERANAIMEEQNARS